MISLKNTLKAISTKIQALDTALSVDYIVEQGTSGMWTYRKWNSGIAECWGQVTASVYYGTSGFLTGGYYSGELTTEYPFTFADTPAVQVSSLNNWNILLCVNPYGSYMTTRWLANQKQTRQTNHTVYIKGKWK